MSVTRTVSLSCIVSTPVWARPNWNKTTTKLCKNETRKLTMEKFFCVPCWAPMEREGDQRNLERIWRHSLGEMRNHVLQSLTLLVFLISLGNFFQSIAATWNGPGLSETLCASVLGLQDNAVPIFHSFRPSDKVLEIESQFLFTQLTIRRPSLGSVVLVISRQQAGRQAGRRAPLRHSQQHHAWHPFSPLLVASCDRVELLLSNMTQLNDLSADSWIYGLNSMIYRHHSTLSPSSRHKGPTSWAQLSELMHWKDDNDGVAEEIQFPFLGPFLFTIPILFLSILYQRRNGISRRRHSTLVEVVAFHSIPAVVAAAPSAE